MRRDKRSAVIGFLLVFVIGALFFVFCKVSDKNTQTNDVDDYADDYYDAYDETPDWLPSLETRGYVVSRQIPECLKKLIDTNLFAVTDEKIRQAEYDYFDGYEGEELYQYYAEDYYDEDEEEQYSPEEIAELIEEEKKDVRMELKEGYEYALKRAEKYGEEKYIQKKNDLFVTGDIGYEDEGEGLYCLLKWDGKTGTCQDPEKIATIESCGFQGFSDLVSEVERQVKAEVDARKKYAEYYGLDEEDEDEEDEEADVGEYYSNECYSLYCQGVTFLMYVYSGIGYVRLEVSNNNSTYYIPEKYRNVIEGIEADGGYFLISSYMTYGKDVLVFSRDNTVGITLDEDDYGYDYGYDYMHESNACDNKRIVFIFEDGKLIDYYMASRSGGMKLDDVDKKVLDTYVSGLGKTLSGMPEVSDIGLYLYRAK